MNNFKDKMKMFESNKTFTPEIKTKPNMPQLCQQSKTDEIDGISISSNNQIGISLLDSNKVLNLNRKESVTQQCDFNEDTDDYTFSFLESVYDLPGFEHFIFDINDFTTMSTPVFINLTTESEPNNKLFNDPTVTNHMEIKDETFNNDIQLAPSPNLIAEIFNTSLWRNSANFSDDFIYNHDPINEVPCQIPDITQSPMDNRRKTQSSGRRSIFSSIFKSKKGSKKSNEKISVKDTDSVKESIDNNKPHNDDDTKSVDQNSKKPLNSIFNRDWLNNVGDGIKKKATVMSELKKMFSHGKFKNFKKISNKNSYDISA